MVSLTIDGKNISVPAGTTILEAARQLGIRIPTLCWLQKVSPTGACRVCAVEVEGVARNMTACNTPVKEGIVVTTQSEQLTAARKKIMELMLVNHPLDCPVCDAGGECDLQDNCYGLEVARQEYSAMLERRPIRYDWKLLESDPNRCILCEKCVKVDHEIVGCDAIAVVNRGEATIIDTVDGQPLDCEFCGNCIAACPTGTLISKPFKFKGRPWTFDVTPSVCPFCSTGCQIEYHSKAGTVERTTSDDTTFNEGNLCINGRFGYAYLNASNRLIAPLLDGQAVSWEQALEAATSRIKAIAPAALAAIASPRTTNEENFLFARLVKGAIGSPNLDSEARLGFAPAIAILKEQLGLDGASATIDRIDNADAILVLGCDLNAESTGMEYRVIKAATKNDAKLVVANMRSVKLKKYANGYLQYTPGGELPLLAGIAKALVAAGAVAQGAGAEAFTTALGAVSLAELATAAGVTEKELTDAARLLAGAKQPAVIFGADIIRSSAARDAVAAAANLGLLLGALGKEAGGIFPVDEKNNTLGMLEMGATPGNGGKDLWGIVEGIENGSIKGLYLLGSNPLVSFPENGRIRAALAKLELLIVQDILAGELTSLAHIVLPAAAPAEKSGTFTTPDGRVQALQQAVTPPGDAREDLAIIADLITRLGGSASPCSEEVMAEIEGVNPLYGNAPRGAASAPAYAAVATASAKKGDLTLLVGPSLYHSGTSTMASENNLTVAAEGLIEISAADAARLAVADGATITLTSPAGKTSGKALVSERVPAGLLFAPYHFPALNAASLLQGNGNTVTVTLSK
jgi:formate dehydrogenase alpha subunit